MERSPAKQTSSWKGDKYLTKTIASKRSGTLTGITGTKHSGKFANGNNLFQGDTNSDSTRKITICSQAGKMTILVGSTSKCPGSRKTETLCKKVGTSDKGSEYFRNCEKILNSFSFPTPATHVAWGNSSQSQRKICSAEKIENLLKKELQ